MEDARERRIGPIESLRVRHDIHGGLVLRPLVIDGVHVLDQVLRDVLVLGRDLTVLIEVEQGIGCAVSLSCARGPTSCSRSP